MPAHNAELETLVSAMCNGTINADESVRLDSLLTADPTAREFYNNCMFLHGELFSQNAAGEGSLELRAETQESELPARKHNLQEVAQLVRNCRRCRGRGGG